MEQTLLRVEDLSKHYIVKKSAFSPKVVVKAVDSISFDIKDGETLGLIGESGSGKSTTGELILRLIESDSGRVIYKGENILNISEGRMRNLRKEIQMIFQSTREALDPKMTIEELISEPLKIYHIVEDKDIEAEVVKLLNMVGMSQKEKEKFGYQLSGGQRQRIGIARAIACRPRFIVCDEPVSALDVSVQGQILNLLIELKQELKLTYLFISHDLKVIRFISDRIAVMYKGRIIEIGKKDEIINNPRYDYTKELIGSML
jgi:peptide/nickel transport system ATP-binding protein/oligopeptide transport system ATP-binding protein